MKNAASVVGMLLPSALGAISALWLSVALRGTSSGEAAAAVTAAGLYLIPGVLAASCLLNLLCTIAAKRRKEKLWKLSTLGVPLCAVLTALTVMLACPHRPYPRFEPQPAPRR